MIDVWNHYAVCVVTSDGEREQVMACRIEPQDINGDGTVDVPVSGECNCLNPDDDYRGNRQASPKDL